MPSQPYLDDTLNHLLGLLAAIGGRSQVAYQPQRRRLRPLDCSGRWDELTSARGAQDVPQNDADAYTGPFYDAAWICAAVLCCGRARSCRSVASLPATSQVTDTRSPDGAVNSSRRRPPVLLGFKKRFGDGYAQRAAEVVQLFVRLSDGRRGSRIYSDDYGHRHGGR